MIPAGLKSPLTIAANSVIRNCLRRGAATANGTRLTKPADEVAALKIFLLGAMPSIAYQWGQILRPWYRLAVTTVFTHKTPMATYTRSGLSYGHALPPPTVGKGWTGWRCELADLLVVVDFPVRGGNWTMRQAGLVQGKLSASAQLLLDPKEYKQHHLMSCWPEFTLSKEGGFKQRRRKLAGLPGGAAAYGLIDPGAGKWMIHEPLAHGNLVSDCETFGEWLAELAMGEDGCAADWTEFSGRTFFRASSPWEWPRLVDELLRITGDRLITKAKSGSPYVGHTRGQSFLVRMMDASEPDPVLMEMAINPSDPDPAVDWPRHGGGTDVPDDRKLPAPEDGPISVLHIRFDPADG
jgi:hypothetical protein